MGFTKSHSISANRILKNIIANISIITAIDADKNSHASIDMSISGNKVIRYAGISDIKD